jgi:acyl-CoA synthetase (AMP-forming)/AMP-acid ligase II
VIEGVETYLALAKASLVGVPIGKLLTAEEGTFVLGDVDARAVVYSAGTAERAGAAVEAANAEPAVLIGIGGASLGAARSGASMAYDDALAGGDTARPAARQARADQDVLIGYTSGTTGFPKGAVVRESGASAVMQLSSMARRLVPHSVGLMTVSLSFPACIPATVFAQLVAGSSICQVNGWDPEKVLRLTEEHRATFASVPSPGIDAFTSAVEARPERIASLRTLMHSGSKAPAEKLERLWAATRGRLIEVLGMMEHSGGPCTATTEHDYGSGDAHDIFDSVGRPLPWCAFRCLAPDGSDLPRGPDNVGELALASPGLFVGYWHNPDATEAALRDGWYRTGDLGWIDDAGYVYIVDRRSDLIVSGGINIYPSELERVLTGHPAVAGALVVGLPHARFGRTPVAVVVRRPGSAVSPEELVAHCRAHLARYKKPTAVLFTEAFPLNASGKVVRREVEEWASRQPGVRG